jgi:hypothetical protein
MLLARVHRDVGLAQQRSGVVAGPGDGNADARLHQQLAPIDNERPGEAAKDLLSDGVHLTRARLLQQDGELVTAQAGHRVLRMDTALDAPRRSSQQRVAHVVAERVVHGLEIVKVDKQHGKGTVVSSVERRVDPLAEQGTVGQLGQRVVRRLVA